MGGSICWRVSVPFYVDLERRRFRIEKVEGLTAVIALMRIDGEGPVGVVLTYEAVIIAVTLGNSLPEAATVADGSLESLERG